MTGRNGALGDSVFDMGLIPVVEAQAAPRRRVNRSPEGVLRPSNRSLICSSLESVISMDVKHRAPEIRHIW